MTIEFRAAFKDLTEHDPFGWQERLYHNLLAGRRYDACDIPTGLGKTSIIPIWLIALATQAAADPDAVTLPRRLVYIVNRRTVVDQATDDAMTIRAALHKKEHPGAAQVADALNGLCVDPNDDASPLAISTLRGEFADNREWQADPARAAIVVGTVDMIGSRLLFSGYGVGRSSRRALAAGLLGQDALLVHDEAHLSAPFGALVREIARVQQDSEQKDREPRPLRVLEMSATPPPAKDTHGAGRPRCIFGLQEDEKNHAAVARRIDARKALRIEATGDGDALVVKLAATALHCGASDAKSRILVYCQTIDRAKEVFGTIKKEVGDDRVRLLIGPLRGRERDGLAETTVFQAFKARADRLVPAQSVFLVATSAGEVGVDLDADHMVCDLTTLDSMIQRLGRVNRLGRDDDFVAQIDVFHAPAGKAADADREARHEKTRNALLGLSKTEDRYDASPRTLRNLIETMTNEGSLADAFAPTPRILPVTDILLDNWALTSVADLPGRPEVADWLHGREDGEPPETVVAWREEVQEIAEALQDGRINSDAVEEWFDAHRIEPQERLREPNYRAAKAFDAMAKRLAKNGALSYALVRRSGGVKAIAIGELDSETIANAAVILPVEAGGLKDGMLDGGSTEADDVADAVRKTKRGDGAAQPTARRWRARMSRDNGVWTAAAVGNVDERVAIGIKGFNDDMSSARSLDGATGALARRIKDRDRPETWFAEEGRVLLTPDDDAVAASRMLVSFAPARATETALDRTESAAGRQELQPHLEWAEDYGAKIAGKLGVEWNIASALKTAAASHDLGKHRRPWQRAIGNTKYPAEVFAKSGHRRFNADLCNNYRHEFGSLIDAMRDETIAKHPERDLILHLIASHHGWARPHFRPNLDDPGANDDQIAAALAETPRRYARLQRRFGRWGLAWLEGLMKAADVMATVHVPPETEDAP